MAITSSHNSVLLPIVWSAIHCRRQIRNHRKLCSRFITKQRKAKKGAKKETERKSLPETKKNSVFATNFPFGFCFVHQSNSSLFFPFFLFPKSENFPSCFDFVWFFPPMGLSEKWKHVLLKTRIDIIN